VKANCVGHREILVGKLTQQLHRTSVLHWADTKHFKWPHILDHGQELKSSNAIVPPQEPSMTFGCNESRGHQSRWIGEESLKERVIRI